MRWFNTARGAVQDRSIDLEADGWTRVDLSEGFQMVPPEDSRAEPQMFEVVYSETRDQYRTRRV